MLKCYIEPCVSTCTCGRLHVLVAVSNLVLPGRWSIRPALCDLQLPVDFYMGVVNTVPRGFCPNQRRLDVRFITPASGNGGTVCSRGSFHITSPSGFNYISRFIPFHMTLHFSFVKVCSQNHCLWVDLNSRREKTDLNKETDSRAYTRKEIFNI